MRLRVFARSDWSSVSSLCNTSSSVFNVHLDKKWQVRKVLLNWHSGGKSLAKDKKMIVLDTLAVLLQIDL